MKLVVIKKGKCTSVFSHQVGDCKYSGFARRKCCFLFRHWVLGAEKRFPTGSELCKGTPRSHHIITLEKDSGNNVPWGLLLYLLLPWVGKIALSGDFVALISKGMCFQKTQILKQSCGCKEEGNEPVCVSSRHQTATTQQSHKEMPLLLLGSKSHANKNKCLCS